VRILRAVPVAGAVVLVDQLAKTGAAHAAPPAHNPDLAFGIAHGSAPVLVALSIIVLGVFLGVVGRLAVHLGVSPVLPALIAGGMLGNMLDRARFGAVRDFIHIPFAIINVADIAIVVGIIVLTVSLARRRHTALSRSSHVRWVSSTREVAGRRGRTSHGGTPPTRVR
jgi:lipoprotein signal peptidase